MFRTKNLATFPFAATLTSNDPPNPQASCVVRMKVALAPGVMTVLEDETGLAQGPLSGPTFDDADDLQLGEVLYPGDFAGWKLNAEVTFRGACHTPKGQPLPECPVKIAVGEWSKSLIVTGRRVWGGGGLLADKGGKPHPFTTMPVDWTTAFGGSGIADNPVGKGLDDELPNVEGASARVVKKGDRPRPTSFAPINPRWPARARLMGKKYDASHKKERGPFYSTDFDGRFFHCAPADQQLKGFLRGDEPVTLHNLHPEHPVLETRLPGTRPRLFVTDTQHRAREVQLRLDTLHIDGHEGCAYLQWRGLTESGDIELLDLTFALVVAEPLGETQPEAHYLAMLDAFEKDPVGMEDARAHFDEHLGRVLDQVPDADADVADEPSAMTKRLAEQLGDLGPGLAAKIDKVLAAGKKAAADLPEPEGGADDEETTPPGDELQQAIDDTASQEPDGKLTSGGKDKRVAAEAVQGAISDLEASREEAAEKGGSPDVVEAYDRILADPRVAQLREVSSAYLAPAEGKLRPGSDLREANLCEADLAGRDLSGCDLSGADLSHANLRGANLRDAKLVGAWLLGTHLDDADLEGADLERALMAEVEAPRARLCKTHVTRALMVRANLTDADLFGMEGELALLSKASLRGARLEHVRLEMVMLESSDFTGASLTHADLRRCQASDACFRNAHFEEALLNDTGFTNADMRGAHLNTARGSRVVFCGADLRKADFSRSRFPEIRLPDADARDANFFGADMRHGIFHRCNLEGADLRHSNLFRADLGRAKLGRATLRAANLYGADLTGASGEKTDFLDANLKRALLPT